MKRESEILIVLLSTILFSMVATAVTASPNGKTSENGDISASDAGMREKWNDPRWHNRMFLNVSSNSLAAKAGRVVSYQVDFSSIPNLDINSIRLVYKGEEIPVEYDPLTSKITFVVPVAMDRNNTEKFTLYYDTIPNGLKPVADYDPSWVGDAVTIASDPDQALVDERDEFFADNDMGETAGVYYYQDQIVYQDPITGNYYYRNGTLIQGYIIEGELLGNPVGTYYYIDPQGNEYQVERFGDQWQYVGGGGTVDADLLSKTYIGTYEGNTYEVYYDAVDGRWEYTNNSVFTGSIDLNSDVYLYKNDTIFFDSVHGTWNYTDGGVLEYWATYDPAATFTFDTITYTGLYTLYNSTPFAVAIYENDTGNLWVWSDSLGTYREAETYDIIDQTIYDGTVFQANALSAITQVEGMSYVDGEVGNVIAYADYEGSYDDGGTAFTQTARVKGFRGSPDVLVNLRNNAPLLRVNPSGKIFINLGGTINIDGTPVGIDDFDEWLEGELASLGISDPDILAMYEDLKADYDEFIASNGRIAVLTSDHSFNIGNFDFLTDPRVVDMTSCTGHNVVSKLLGDGAISVKVIPMSLVSDYVALYDLVTHQGFGIKFSDAESMINMLVEVWEAVTPTDVYNYVTIGLNYIGWDWDDVNDIYKLASEYAGYYDAYFDAIMTFINSIDPTTLLDELFTTYSDMTTEELNRDPSLPLDIIVHSPLPGTKVQTGDDLFINITVTGETLSDVYYFVKVNVDDTPRYMSFDQWNDFWTGDPQHYHQAKKFTKLSRYDWATDVNIVIAAFDTNGDIILAESKLIVDGVIQNLIWTITIVTGSSIFALFGIASYAGKRKGRIPPNPADCIDGKCEL